MTTWTVRMRIAIRLDKILVYAALTALPFAAILRAEDRANIPPRRDYAAVATTLESVIRQEMEEKQLPAFSIALVDGKQIVWAQGFGYQDSEHKIPATAHTVYR